MTMPRWIARLLAELADRPNAGAPERRRGSNPAHDEGQGRTAADRGQAMRPQAVIDQLVAAGFRPLVTVQQDGLHDVEAWAGNRKLSLVLHNTHIEVLKVWGSAQDIGMEECTVSYDPGALRVLIDWLRA